jgi:hypothetical protein
MVWKDSIRSNNAAESFTLNEYEDVVYVTFSSFQRIEDFIVNENDFRGSSEDIRSRRISKQRLIDLSTTTVTTFKTKVKRFINYNCHDKVTIFKLLNVD